jgi:hypothetical protein
LWLLSDERLLLLRSKLGDAAIPFLSGEGCEDATVETEVEVADFTFVWSLKF